MARRRSRLRFPSKKNVDMFSLFRKKESSYPNNSKWSILKGSNQDKVMIVRRNDSAKQLTGHPEYIYRAGFAIPLLNPTSDGLPTNEETTILNLIEDELSLNMEANQDGLLTLVITTSGFREFVFYTRKPNDMQSIALSLSSKFAPHKVQSYVSEDKKWDVYRQYS